MDGTGPAKMTSDSPPQALRLETIVAADAELILMVRIGNGGVKIGRSRGGDS